MNKLQIYPCGTQVMISMGGIVAMITASIFRFGKVAYELTYFVEGEEKTSWKHEEEFQTMGNVKKETIGFKTN